MKNILISGGAGFIGSNFIHYLRGQHPDLKIVNLDALTYAGNLDNLAEIATHPEYEFVQGDIRDERLVRSVLQEHQIDTIVHFAAETHVDRSILGPAIFVKTNIEGTFNLLNCAKEVWSDQRRMHPDQVRFHHISTDEVFGSLRETEAPFTENSPYRPNSPYAASKAAADHLVRAYSKTYQLPITITNCSNNYGPFQFPEKMVPVMISKAIKGEPLPIYGDGLHRRDWLYVEDHCDALWQVLSRGTPGEMYNIGGSADIPNLELVHTVCAILDESLPNSAHRPHHSLIAHVPDRPGHDFRYAIDSSKICNNLDWAPRHSLEDGLRKTVAWYLENKRWVENIQNRPAFADWMDKNYTQRGGSS